MSVVGFDLGNESSVVAVARQSGIDVVLNDESKSATPAIVCFGDKQRFFGTAGAASTMMNPKNSISQIKRLIGRKFNDPELQRDIKSLPFSVTEGPDGYPLINVRYLGKHRTFTPTQILGMVLSDLKGIAEKNLNAEVVDCCIGIPVYFTDLQRRAVLDAATIARLHPLRLIHETTATALAYDIYKTDLPENDQLNVAFVDIGHASMQVCIAGFKKGQLKILAHSFDRSLGGRDFDEVLFQHFAAKFKVEYKIDVYQNARACLRLRVGVENLKKMLSENPEVSLNIECLMDEKDVRGFIKRDEFEQISVPILERVKKPLEKALEDAGLTVDDVHTVEVVGSGSCVPAIIKILTEFFKKEPRRTMNASECVARGSALECAILSPTLKVRDFQVNESFPFPIALSWKAADSYTQNGLCRANNQQNTIVFCKGNPIPSVKALTFYRSSTFSVDVLYADVNELQAPAKISTYMIGPFQSTKSEHAKVKVKAWLNLHGIVSVESATLKEEEDFKPVQMETYTEVESKKEVKKANIPVTEVVYGGMVAADVQKALEEEYAMALEDWVMEETKDRKNAVEAYVYDTRNKLSDKYQDFVTNSEREELTAKLQEVEDWLYEDGEDETKGVYVAKLEELKKQGDPIEERHKEYVNRGAVIDQFIRCVSSYREAAMFNDPRFDHIDISDKQKVLNECLEAETWLREKKQQQDSLHKYANPFLLSSDVLKKAEAVGRFCRPIMMKPRPAPANSAASETPPTPPPQGSDQQLQVMVEQAFTHSKVVSITSDFKNFIGEGGFGKVFLGILDGTQVAVKSWKTSSRQGNKEFKDELEHMTVHHKNLVSLIGYCDEGDNKALIYEYMANGSLRNVLSEEGTKILTWEERLKIALDAAQGLEYLHDGCTVPIVHRDVRTSNILLNENWEAKLADFGLCRVFPTENVSHVSTDTKGTNGYLDPEYDDTIKLTKASDIFSFGVVLLELVTGRPAIATDATSFPIHIFLWVKSLYLKGDIGRIVDLRLRNHKGDIGSIIDPRLRGTYNCYSARIIIETALACLKFPSTQRPKISEVCDELKKSQECLSQMKDPLLSLMVEQAFTHSEVVRITSDFKNFIGEGGFGKVFLGTLDGTQVAVKSWKTSSRQGNKEFKAELEHLTVHHKNLVSLIGYCDEGDNKALIYEYMANGNLCNVLSEEGTKILTWEERLKIALDAAQGLEYLHDGCTVPIVHRDVKTSNILLNENWEAKLADFGLCRVFPTENVSHVSTDAKGTNGYLDPEYNATRKLYKASDIFSFGVVLLELVTSRPATITKPNSFPIHIFQWVNSLYDKGDIGSIVDPRLWGTCNSNSAKNIIETAFNCLKFPAIQRLKISEVCDELKKSQKLHMDAERSQIMESEKKSSSILSGIFSQLRRSGWGGSRKLSQSVQSERENLLIYEQNEFDT